MFSSSTEQWAVNRLQPRCGQPGADSHLLSSPVTRGAERTAGTGSLQQTPWLSTHPVLHHAAHKADDAQVLFWATATLATCFTWASEVFCLLSHGSWHVPTMCSLRNAAGRISLRFQRQRLGPAPVPYSIFPTSLSADQNPRGNTLVSCRRSRDTARFGNRLNEVWLEDSTAGGGQSQSRERAGCPGDFHGNAVKMTESTHILPIATHTRHEWTAVIVCPQGWENKLKRASFKSPLFEADEIIDRWSSRMREWEKKALLEVHKICQLERREGAILIMAVLALFSFVWLGVVAWMRLSWTTVELNYCMLHTYIYM